MTRFSTLATGLAVLLGSVAMVSTVMSAQAPKAPSTDSRDVNLRAYVELGTVRPDYFSSPLPTGASVSDPTTIAR